MSIDPEALLIEWFGDDLESPDRVGSRIGLWFAGGAELDERLRERFAAWPERAAAGELASWLDAPRSCLAFVLVTDQLPRNLFRGDPRAFAFDGLAREAARHAIARGDDRLLHPVEAMFLYMPLEHAEDAGLQAECVERFRALARQAPAPLVAHFERFVEFAERHRAVIDRFGRFPHRNAVLGRASTDEETQYLAEGGETFSEPAE